MFTTRKYWHPFVSPLDPCPPITTKQYVTAPNLYIRFQPPGMQQFSPKEALFAGTLWCAFYDPYFNAHEMSMREAKPDE